MESYKSLVAWKLAHEFAVATLKSTDRAWTPRAKNAHDQLRRAAISVPTNIVEGYALGTSPQFARHLRIAVGSAAEAEYAIVLCRYCGYLSPETADELAHKAARMLSVLYGLLRKIRART